MITAMLTRSGKRQLTFEDLKGLRAEGYIRESSKDQRDGFGPDVQRRFIEGFATTYSLVLGLRWYTECITSFRRWDKRTVFQQIMEDAGQDLFDVLLVYRTSRFGRNQEECIRYKRRLQELDKVVVFVSQGIISGNRNDFINERINETMDEAYSLTLSEHVADGLRQKFEHGLANGVPPLGYKSEKLENGKRERKVPDPKSMPALLELLRCYASGCYSYQTLADHLNAQGYRNREGEPFTEGSLEHVLSNRFYEGKVVYHPGKADEEAREGNHEVPEEVTVLWLKCQDLKRERTRQKEGRPRLPRRAYPFARVAVCDECSRPHGGQPVHRKSGEVVRRLYHGRPFCKLKPHSVRVEHLMAKFHRKQHLWGDITDEEYRQQKQDLERQLKPLVQLPAPVHLPNLERAAQLLADLPALWKHPGVTDEQREAFVGEMFHQVRLRGRELVAIHPKPVYQPLFAYMIASGVRKCRGEWT